MRMRSMGVEGLVLRIGNGMAWVRVGEGEGYTLRLGVGEGERARVRVRKVWVRSRYEKCK